nr:hypothetical protein [Streptomyces sp. 846.5]
MNGHPALGLARGAIHLAVFINVSEVNSSLFEVLPLGLARVMKIGDSPHMERQLVKAAGELCIL